MLSRAVEVALEDFLEARVTRLAGLNNGQKKDVIEHVRNNRVAVENASMPGSSGHSNHRPGDAYRIDRQTPEPPDATGEKPKNAEEHKHKVAVQTNGRNSRTVAQVAIVRNDKSTWTPGAGRVSRGLIKSAKTGREITIKEKKTPQAQADARAAKTQRNRDKQAAGNARAEKGIFRKGKVPGPTNKTFTKINNWPKRVIPEEPQGKGGKGEGGSGKGSKGKGSKGKGKGGKGKGGKRG